MTDGTSFSRLLWHSARKRIGFLQPCSPHARAPW